MKYFAILFSVLFIFSAFLQLNDPDPVWWSTLYLVVAYVGIQAFRGKYNCEMLIVLSILYLSISINSWMQMTAWEGFLSKGMGMAMKTPNQELAREAMGMVICIFFMIICCVFSITKKKKID